MPNQPDAFYFEKATEAAWRALRAGNDGFGCLLVGANGDVLMEQGNAVADENDPTAHDAMALIRRATREFSADTLAGCTIYATMEPCVMCMGAAFWAGISKVKYAVAEEDMERILPGGLAIHSAEFCARSPKPIECEGPVADKAAYDKAFAVLLAWVDRILGK